MPQDAFPESDAEHLLQHFVDNALPLDFVPDAPLPVDFLGGDAGAGAEGAGAVGAGAVGAGAVGAGAAGAGDAGAGAAPFFKKHRHILLVKKTCSPSSKIKLNCHHRVIHPILPLS